MTGPFECTVTAVGRNGGEDRHKVTLPFKVESGDELILDLQFHRWAAHLGSGRVIYFASYKRASNEVLMHGGPYGFVSDVGNPLHLRPKEDEVIGIFEDAKFFHGRMVDFERLSFARERSFSDMAEITRPFTPLTKNGKRMGRPRKDVC